MKWSPQQDDALKAVSAWLIDPTAPQIFRLFGYAGTGKSTLARHLAQSARSVCYAAFTGKAALVMKKNGCHDASTIHSLIYNVGQKKSGERTYKLNKDSPAATAELIVIDEVSMVGQDLAKDLLSFGTKILVLGDPFQLPPVNGEGFFINADPDVMLTEIHRQAAENPIVQLSIDIREGKRLQIGNYGASRIISRSDLDREEMLQCDQILCGKNLTRIQYNDRIRKIDGKPHREPVTGDRLICLKNNKTKHIFNGQIATVEHVSEETIAGIKCQSMRVLPEDHRYPVKVDTPNQFFAGDEENLDWRVRKKFDEYYFGYVITVHKAQGSQWDNVFVFDESGVFRDSAQNHLYTAVTRAAEKITVVVV
ncbi:ATP-dependent DNA helicase [Maritalea porphyrae]|uniref:ATP-dependent DNA helicase n=1 Tax=Maritalea porphyrae TaxID=880732 RepID=UPI0022AF2855|nr:AAA family ATPase [Maritalea porphyrae]MCZ4270773.1 AAA family ATPase [Maritalea porphyrae]